MSEENFQRGHVKVRACESKHQKTEGFTQSSGKSSDHETSNLKKYQESTLEEVSIQSTCTYSVLIGANTRYVPCK